MLTWAGKPAEAEIELRTALATDRKLADENLAVTEFRERLASSHQGLGDWLWMAGKPAEAEAEFARLK